MIPAALRDAIFAAVEAGAINDAAWSAIERAYARAQGAVATSDLHWSLCVVPDVGAVRGAGLPDIRAWMQTQPVGVVHSVLTLAGNELFGRLLRATTPTEGT